MPQTPRELIDDAKATGDWNAVADWFENFDWSQAEEIPVGELLLEQTVRSRNSSERQFAEAVAAARARGTSWDRIGEMLAISGSEAQQRYGTEIDETEAVSR